jgi:hypothetical protein
MHHYPTIAARVGQKTVSPNGTADPHCNASWPEFRVLYGEELLRTRQSDGHHPASRHLEVTGDTGQHELHRARAAARAFGEQEKRIAGAEAFQCRIYRMTRRPRNVPRIEDCFP